MEYETLIKNSIKEIEQNIKIEGNEPDKIRITNYDFVEKPDLLYSIEIIDKKGFPIFNFENHELERVKSLYNYLKTYYKLDNF